MKIYICIARLFLFLFLLNIGVLSFSQTAQIINPNGGVSTSFNDGLKVVVNTSGKLAVYRGNLAQYCCSYTYPNGSNGGVDMTFRFDNGSTYSSTKGTWTVCSTTPATQSGNNWTTSIAGYVTSPISGKKFYVTINFAYTHPNKYFFVDYYVRAPHDLTTPETVHIYLDHDANIKGSDGSRGYMIQNSTGHYVGNYRTASDNSSTCARYSSGVSPSAHGFKTSGTFRSYYSGAYGSRSNINNSTLQLQNIVQTANCVDDGIAVEFTIGPLSAGQTGARRVMHAYGDNQTEFNNIVVTNPTPPAGQSSPVTVNFTSASFSENEGNASHSASAIKITVSGGTLLQEQVCNFTASGGTAVQGTDYTYVKGFIIPAGNYSTARTFTLDNFTIIGNTTCQSDRSFTITIDSETCNDLVLRGTTYQTTYTILDDDKPTVNQVVNANYCTGTVVPANTFVFTGSTIPNTTYSWTNNNTAIGLGASGTGNLPAFTAANATSAPITSTITVTPVQGSCQGNPMQFTITVNPTPTVTTNLSNVTYCTGVNVAAVTLAGAVSGTTFAWTNSNTAIGLAASGTGNLPAFVASNTTNAPITSTITVIPTANGCTGTPKSYTVTVNPTPTVTANLPNGTYCTGENVAAITLAGPVTGTTFSWTNSNTAIGLAASGTGNLPAFVASNTTNGPITSTITVTPTANGCTGTPKSYTVTVNPTPTVSTNLTNGTYCNGANVAAITLAGPVTGTTFAWTNSNPAIGLAASGTGNLPAFVASNTTNAPITATITVIPTANGCTGTPKSYTITVNPTPTVSTTLSNATYCDGENVAAIALAGPVTGTTFAWTNSNTAIGLAASGTGNIPAFVANNTTNAPITATITVTPTANGCTGTPASYTLTIRPRVVVGNITGNPYTCLNENAQPLRGVATTGGSGTFTYQWQSSPDGSAWSDIPGATGLTYSPGTLSQDTYFRLVSKDAVCGDYYSTNFKITIIPEDVSFRWLENAVDNDWNNPANWENSLGLLDAVPTLCSQVYIGSSQKTPSLDPVSTTLEPYGQPSVKNITFSYGGQLAYPHNLIYDKAFVRYNWGIYGTDTPSGGASLSIGDPLSDTYLLRNKWHMLAAPLKKMTPGDFSLAGYPFTWQQDFVLHTTPTAGGAILADFSKPFSRNDIDLSTQNNAIVVKVAGAGSSTGYNKHTHLEGLKGVMEMPYFENPAVAAFRSGHSYNPLRQTSIFYYYDASTLQLLSSPVGSLKRSSEAYRFIYEEDDKSTPVIASLDNVKGYTLPVSTMVPGGAVMIGNPYMSSINMKNFIDANTNVDATKGYYVFDGNTETWKQFSYTATNNISPLQAFVVTLQPAITDTDLYFPLEGTYALTGANYKGNSRIGPGGRSILVTISEGMDNYGKDSDTYAILASADEFENDVPKILYTENKSSDLYFISKSKHNTGNLVQVVSSDVDVLDIGLRNSDSTKMQVLRFDNIEGFVTATGKYPVLIDKDLKIEQNLLLNPVYHFTHNTNGIDETRLSVRFSDYSNPEAGAESLSVLYYQKGILEIQSAVEVKQIQIYDLKGQLLNNLAINPATSFYNKFIPLPQGVYLIQIKTVDDQTHIRKIHAVYTR